MATALAETVSQYVPTFEPLNYIKQLPNTPASPNGAGEDETTLNTLVLTQELPSDTASNASSSSARSSKSDKMKKKLDYEAGSKSKSHKRVTNKPSSHISQQSSASVTSSQPQATLKRGLNHTVSSHNLKGSASDIKNSSNSLKGSGSVQRKASNAGLPIPRRGSNAFVPPRKGSSAGLKSSMSKSITASDVGIIAEAKKTMELKNSGSNLKRSNSSEIRKSGNIQRKSALSSQSGLRNAVKVESKGEALDAILSDFQMQKQRAIELSQVENEIYKEEVAKYEAMLLKKKQDSDAAVALANAIRERETNLAALYAELDEKEQQYKDDQEEFTAIKLQFEEELKNREAALAESSGGTESTAALRLKEAQHRKELKEAWKTADSTDPSVLARKRVMLAQDVIAEIQRRITEAKKELGKMKGQAAKGKSSDQRLRDERLSREDARKSTAHTKTEVQPKVRVPKQVVPKAHTSRLEEEKMKRAAKRRPNNDVADLIAEQAGVSRGQSPYRAGMVGTKSEKSKGKKNAKPTPASR